MAIQKPAPVRHVRQLVPPIALVAIQKPAPVLFLALGLAPIALVAIQKPVPAHPPVLIQIQIRVSKLIPAHCVH